MPTIKGANGVTNDLPGMVAVQLTRAITISTGGTDVVYGRAVGLPEIVVVPRNDARYLPGIIVSKVPAGSEATYYVGSGA